jgi:hydrogenase maturation protease
MAQSAQEKVLLIGYGNTLRGDDGVGPFVVSEVARRHADRFRACVVQQLTPELCTILAEHEAVIFVDASDKCDGDACRLVPVEIGGSTGWGTHLSSPPSLLALTEELYGSRPRAWWLLVPGEDFRLGEGLSALARVGARDAVRTIEECLRLL